MYWISKYWAKTGGIISLGIILFVLLSGMKLTDLNSLLWLHFAALLLHQFEEYVYPGKFKEFFNGIQEKSSKKKYPLNDLGIVLVNIIFGWTAYLLSAIFGEKILWLAFGLAGITITNGVFHTIMSFMKGSNIPGVLTGVFLFIPLGLFILITTIRIITVEAIISGIVVLIAGTAIIPISILVTNKVDISKIQY